jgi:adenylate kinase
MLNLILFGPPGSGKGTQASKLVEKYNLLHISTGDLFRYELTNNTPLGVEAKKYMNDGKLVPDAITIEMLKNKVLAHPEVSGIIFDGFPRTIPQAEALNALMTELNQSITMLVALEVEDDEIVSRLLNRGKTSGRADDNDEAVIRNRMATYRAETVPVFDFYKNQNKALSIPGMGTVEEIFEVLYSHIDKHL